MRMLYRLFFLSIISLLSGCADLFQSQPPAPILGRYPDGSPSMQPSPPVQSVPEPPPVIVTKPLENIDKKPELTEIKPDLPPPPAQETVPPIQTEMPPEDLSKNPDLMPEAPPVTEQKTDEAVPPAEKTEDQVPPIADTASPAPKEPEPYTPLESIGPQSPAVGSLVLSANENSQSGNYDSAVASIERAIRIEPRNAALYYKLAVLRLNQSKPRLAEDIARKAALLAVNDTKLKKHSWLLIANARELQNNFAGAEKAKAEAAKY